MQIIFSGILLLCVISQQIYPKDSLLVDTNDYRLFYVGRIAKLDELKSKFISGSIFVNIPIDSSFYKPEYPNPFSPSMVKHKFLYELKDSADVSINITNSIDSILLNVKFNNQTKGYYSFIIKENYFMSASVNKKVLSSIEDFKIDFLIKDKNFIFPLRNTSINQY